MDKVINKTVDVLSRLGEKIERQLSPDEKDGSYYERPSSEFMYAQARPVYRRPLDKKNPKNNIYSKSRNLIGGNARKYSSDNLAASPGYSSFNNYRQNPERQRANDGANRPPYGTGIGAPLNYGGYSNASAPMQYGPVPGNVGYAPDYYIAERRQLELVPAPQPRIIRQQVPVPVAVDRPVPQPYPVQVPVPYAVDRPVPVPVPSPVPFDRPVPVPVPVAVQSPPVYVQVPVPTPVPCYVPVAVPVPSPPPSPVVYEQSITHTQRWTTGSPAMVNQQSYPASSPVIVNQQSYPASSPVMVNQQSYPAGSPVIINQQSYPASSSATGLNPYGSFGNGSFVR